MNTQKMAVGYQLGGMAPLGINRALTYFARLSQFDSVWLPDHWQGIIPSALWKQEFPWAASQHDSPHALFEYQTLMGYLAHYAGKLRLGVSVTEPIRRHPVLIAQAMLTLAHMTKRPPILGIGAGERENIEPYGLDFSEAVSKVEEALQILRLCFSHQGSLDFYGKHFRLDHAVMDQCAPAGKTPEIWIGAQGPRMLRLTGRYADGWLPYPITSPQEYADKLKVIRTAAQEAGRDPQAITPGLVQFIAVASTEAEVLKMQNSKFGRLFGLLAPAEEWQKLGVQHPFGEHFRGYMDWLPEQYDRQTLEKALAMVPSALIGYGPMWGTPEQVTNRLRAFGAAGARHIVMVPISAMASRQAAIYGLWATRKIARRLRSSS